MVLDEWLRGIFVVESMQAGLAQAHGLSPGEMLVTREGHIITRHSLTYYAPDSQLHGVLARQREIGPDQDRNGWAEGRSDRLRISACRRQQKGTPSLEIMPYHACVPIPGSFSNSSMNAEMQALKLTQLAERANQRSEQIESELAEIEHQARGKFPQGGCGKKN